MTDSSLRYFVAISENKRKEMELRNQESKIDDLKKKMLTKYWKDKIGVFDEMIRLNVRTPTYKTDRTKGSEDGQSTTMSLGPMNIDSKLLSSRPVTLQKGNKPGTRIEPIINIEGTDAVCYPNKEAKRGRRVGLNQQILRRIEQCKTLEDSIASLRCKSARRAVSDDSFRNNWLDAQRPQTAPGLSKNGGRKDEKKRPDTGKSESSDVVRRPSTTASSYRREGFITSTPEQKRPSTSVSFRIDSDYT